MFYYYMDFFCNKVGFLFVIYDIPKCFDIEKGKNRENIDAQSFVNKLHIDNLNRSATSRPRRKWESR